MKMTTYINNNWAINATVVAAVVAAVVTATVVADFWPVSQNHSCSFQWPKTRHTILPLFLVIIFLNAHNEYFCADESWEISVPKFELTLENCKSD